MEMASFADAPRADAPRTDMTETSLTLADLCAAIERGDLPYTVRDGEVVVHQKDVRAYLGEADDASQAQNDVRRPRRSA